MDKNRLSKMEDLSVELACTADNLSLMREYAAEILNDNPLADGLFSICRHIERISDDYETLIMEERKSK